MSSDGGRRSVDLAPFGLAVGHATDQVGATGCTVVRGIDGPFRAAAAVIGRATGTRELDAVTPEHLVDRVDAILLTGGSAYGLDAAAGVMRWMEERGRGFDVGVGVVPIVPAAVVFDLAPLGRPDARPTPAMAYAACDSATSAGIPEGSVGAGTGATVGKGAPGTRPMKGGFGCAVARTGAVGVAALAVVNAYGDVRDEGGAIIAGARDDAGAFAGSVEALRNGALSSRFGRGAEPPAMRNTSLCVVATDHPVDRLALRQIAQAASAALFRRITPAGTSLDGDVVFAICPHAPPRGDTVMAMQVETLAVAALEEAIERAVRRAQGREGVIGLADQDDP